MNFSNHMKTINIRLKCDICGVVKDGINHFSGKINGVYSNHIHICEDCVHELGINGIDVCVNKNPDRFDKSKIKFGDIYYSVGPLQDGNIEEWSFTDDRYDRKRMNQNNFFLSKDEAKQFLSYMREFNATNTE